MIKLILVLWWLLLGLLNGGRAVMALTLAPALSAYTLSVPLSLLAGFYGLLCIGCFAWSIGLQWSRSSKHFQRWMILAALIYQTAMWLLRIFAYRSDYARSLWARDLITTGIFIVMMYILSKLMTKDE